MRYLISALMLLLLTGCVATPVTHAYHYDRGVGRVVSVEGIGRDVYTHRPRVSQYVCTPTQVHSYTERGHGGTIIGAIAGAALGSRIGGGSGRTIATASGAVIGGAIGSDYNQPRHRTHTQSHCYWTTSNAAHVHHVIDYYIVRVHDDRGQEFTIRMSHPPRIGSYIRF